MASVDPAMGASVNAARWAIDRPRHPAVNAAMRGCLPRMVQGRAIISVVALYALVLAEPSETSLDLGKVIGRNGRTATALRTLVAGIGGRGIRVDVVDTDQ